ncbi:MAG: hypothetical protein AABZ44_08040 [Elusimicrobiota bacterium]
MRMMAKWLIIAGFASGFVFLMAGMWYKSNVFGYLFEQKLKQELVALLYINQNKVITSISQSPKLVTIEEIDLMKSFLKDPRIAYALVINKYGQIRWAPETTFFGRRINDSDVMQARPLPTDAIAKAYLTKSPQVISFDREGGQYYEVAFPLLANNDIRGVVSLEVSRKEIHETLSQGMRRFYAGSILIMFVFLACGAVFIYLNVLAPIKHIQDTVEEISLTQPAWPQERMGKDEIGGLERTLAAFLDKLRATMSRFEKGRKDMTDIEQDRWQQILQILVPSGVALILDNDNYVLAGHNIESLVKKGHPETPGQQQPQRAGLPDMFQRLPKAAVEAAPTAAAPVSKTHLLDFVTSTELLQLINKALERPGHFIEGNLVLDSLPHKARIMTLASGVPKEQRTIVWLDSDK